jgi:hypothetical protein
VSRSKTYLVRGSITPGADVDTTAFGKIEATVRVLAEMLSRDVPLGGRDAHA